MRPPAAAILPALFAALTPERQEELNVANARFFRPPPGGDSAGAGGASGVGGERTRKVLPKRIAANTWPRSSRGRRLRRAAARPYVMGVEVRELSHSHPLGGRGGGEEPELGLFAARDFGTCDVVGEYCGEVYEGDGGSEYATYLEDREGDSRYPLGVDATREGNECRFINHFAGIASEPNVAMRIAYVNELPVVMVICTKDIACGEELLLRYSDEFVEEYCS